MPKSKKTSFIHTMESRNKNVKKSPPELPDDVRRDEMDLIFHQCRKDNWKSVLDAVKKKPHVGLGEMVMDNHISTTIMHQAITSKGDLDLRAKVILMILEVTPAAAHMRNGYGSLPLHVIAQRNTKIKSGVKDTLIRALVDANVDAITNEGGPGKRTPLHIIFTDYVSPELTQMMINLGPRACFMRDKKGLLPAHVACMRHCSPEKLRMLLAVNPEALFALTNDGESLLDLAKSNSTKTHPNYALVDELNQQLARRQQAASHNPPPYIPHTPVSSEDAGSASRNRVGSSDSDNSHPSVAEVAKNMGQVTVSMLPGQQQQHDHDHPMGSWEQQPQLPYQQFLPHELQSQHHPMPPLQLAQEYYHQQQQQQQQQYHHHQYFPQQQQQQLQQQQSHEEPPQLLLQHGEAAHVQHNQHSRKRTKVTEPKATVASEALLLLATRNARDQQPASQGPWENQDDMNNDDEDNDEADQPTQFAKV